jgi:hypothetical protein
MSEKEIKPLEHNGKERVHFKDTKILNYNGKTSFKVTLYCSSVGNSGIDFDLSTKDGLNVLSPYLESVTVEYGK